MTTSIYGKYMKFQHALLQSPNYMAIPSKNRQACVHFVTLAAKLTSKSQPNPDELEGAYGPALSEAKKLVAAGLLTVSLPGGTGEPTPADTKEKAVPVLAPVPANEVGVPPSGKPGGEQPPIKFPEVGEQSVVPASPDEKSTTDDPLATFKIHPVAAIFPIMSGKPMDEFTADIKANGLRDPIVMSDGQVVDGRNRLIGCIRAGIKPTFIEWTERGSIVQWIISVNLHRRHLNDSQRAIASARVAEVLIVEGKQRSMQNLRSSGRSAENLDPESRDQGSSAEKAAALLNVSKDAVAKATKVIKAGTKQLVEAVTEGTVSLDAASKVATLPQSKQQDVLNKGKTKEAAKAIREENAATSRAKAKKTDGSDKENSPLSVASTVISPGQAPTTPITKSVTAPKPLEGGRPNWGPLSRSEDIPVLQELHDALDAMVTAASAMGKVARVQQILAKLLEAVSKFKIEFEPKS